MVACYRDKKALRRKTRALVQGLNYSRLQPFFSLPTTFKENIFLLKNSE
jgi:hypothetical protein